MRKRHSAIPSQGGSGFDLLMLVFGYSFTESVNQVSALLGLSDGLHGQYAPLPARPEQPPCWPHGTKPCTWTGKSLQACNGTIAGRGQQLYFILTPSSSPHG